MSTCFTLCVLPLGSCFLESPEPAAEDESQSFACSSGPCLGYKTHIVSGEKGSELLINISARPLLEQMENVKFVLCSAELGVSPLPGGVAALLKAERTLLLHTSPPHKNSGFC